MSATELVFDDLSAQERDALEAEVGELDGVEVGVGVSDFGAKSAVQAAVGDKATVTVEP